MVAKDYYAILGLSDTATDKEIKAAFRKLAKRYHPDTNPGNQKTESKFKEISEAYEILGNAAKKSQYDQLRKGGPYNFQEGPWQQPGNGMHGASDFEFGNLGDLFSSMFGNEMPRGGSRRRTSHKGENQEIEVEIPFDKAVHGGSISLSLPRTSSCGACHGTGSEPGYSPERCPDCRGIGTVQFGQGGFAISRPCPRCRGKGHIITHPCHQCHGDGTIQTTRTLRIKIPEGTDTGTRIRIKGEGHPGMGSMPPGDLYVIFQVQQDSIFQRKGKDIFVDAAINAFQAMTGTEIEVPTLKGKVRMKIPPGTQPGAQLRLKGQGLPSLKGLEKGDQFVRIKVIIPRNLTESQKRLVKEIEESLNHE